MAGASHLLEMHGTLEPARAAAPSGQAATPPAASPPSDQSPGAPPALPPGAFRPGAFRPGDVGTLTLEATTDGARVRWPTQDELAQALGKSAAVLDDGGDAAATGGPGGGTAQARAWKIQVLMPPGEQHLGPLTLTVVGPDGAEIEHGDVPAIPLTVASVLEPPVVERLQQEKSAGADKLHEAIGKELAPVRGPWRLAPEIPFGLLLMILAAILILALAAWLWLRRDRPVKVAPPVPLEAPEVVARRRLEALRAGSLLQRGQHLAWHVELADILKEYMGRRTGTDVRDLTTDEVRRLLRGELRALPRVEPGFRDHVGEVRGDILEVLSGCDLVKFARTTATPSEAVARLGTVDRVVTRTTPLAVPVGRPGEAERGAA